MRKYLGLDQVVENLVRRLGDVHLAIVTGDYAKGKDSGTIDLLVVGNIDTVLLDYLVQKTEMIINRKILPTVLDQAGFQIWKQQHDLQEAIVLWNGQKF